MGLAQLEAALTALGELLASRRACYEIVVVGGANLILRRLIDRPTTRDIDVLGELISHRVRQLRPMPEPLRRAVADVARTYGLAPDWVNTAPDSLLDLGLPDGFIERLERKAFGGLVVWLAGRFDMVCFKLYAAVDQGMRSRHFQDLSDLHPTSDELVDASRWAMTHDPSPGFRLLLIETLSDLGMEDPDASLG